MVQPQKIASSILTVTLSTLLVQQSVPSGSARTHSQEGQGAPGSSSVHYRRMWNQGTRWHPQGKYLLTNQGIIGLGNLPLAKSLAFRGSLEPALARFGDTTYIFAGCDWSPTGDRIVLSWLPGTNGATVPQSLWLTPSHTLNRPRLVGGEFGAINFAPAWEPSGKRIAFLSYAKRYDRKARLCVVTPGEKPRVLLPAVSSERFHWSPRGGKILVHVNTRNFYDAVIVDADTGDSRRVLSSPALKTPQIFSMAGRSRPLPLPGDFFPQAFGWSPDGQQILFGPVSSPDTNDHYGLYSLRLDTGTASPLVPVPKDFYTKQEYRYAIWSPDGKEIAFVRQKYIGNGLSENDTIVALNVHTKKQRILFRGKETLSDLSWSLDGRWIAFWARYDSTTAPSVWRVSVRRRPRIQRLQ